MLKRRRRPIVWWGIRVNEALLSGLPVVVSDGVGASILVRTSGAGEVFRAGSEQSLAEHLETLSKRLAAGGEVFEKVSDLRDCITPAAAADFLAEVVDYLDRGNLQSPRPVPMWDRMRVGSNIAKTAS